MKQLFDGGRSGDGEVLKIFIKGLEGLVVRKDK